MRAVRPVAVVALVAILALVATDLVFAATFPTFARLRYTFSATYLEREIGRLRSETPIVVLGDSTLWGYGVDEDRAAVSLVRTTRPDWTNLAYAGGSPVNTRAMLRLLLAAGVRPKAVVFAVNEKEFNVADSSYDRLYPGVEQLVSSGRQPADRIENALSRMWKFYGMRSDVRDALFHDVDAGHAIARAIGAVSGANATRALAHRPSPETFEGTYDLSPLTAANASFTAMLETAATLRRERIRAYAILVPTNHALLHDYIDVPEYGENLATVRKALRSSGVTTLDFDRALPSRDFIDNDHLTIDGNRRLASLLEARIPR